MKKICIIVSRYSTSGVPISQIRLANELSKLNYDIDLVFINSLGVNKSLINSRVNVICERIDRTRKSFIYMFRLFRFGNYNLVISSEDHLNVVSYFSLKLSSPNTPIAISSRVSPVLFPVFSDKILSKPWIMKVLMKYVSKRANLHSCVSTGLTKEYISQLNNNKICTVYNIVVTRENEISLEEDLDLGDYISKSDHVFMTVGRLTYEKGYDVVLKAMSKLKELLEFKYYIIGEGNKRQELEVLVTELGLTNYVVFLGHKDNPIRYMKHAQVFVMGSQIESLGNVLVESIQAGCSPVAFDCPQGPTDILQGGRFGGLVPLNDVDRMADEILMSIKSPLKESSRKSLLSPFTSDAVVSNYIELIE
ncbi:glycosyltransferase [Vibrio splendidus]|uniref:glycosyltransferase n=1 Tax=Vibrio splendidus TaxID=29497 RepID=UPI000C844B9E|nr:glycosyltransferase [Vibrio splendidus]PMK12101.1 hypothetical protein BCU08_05125 [Vibrio splendidus]